MHPANIPASAAANASPEALDSENLLALARNLFAQARYEESEKVFRLLFVRNPLDPRFVTGHAAALEATGNHQAAMLMHLVHFTMDMGNVAPCVRFCESLMALGRKDEAADALRTVIEASDSPRAPEGRRAGALLKLLSTKDK